MERREQTDMRSQGNSLESIIAPIITTVKQPHYDKKQMSKYLQSYSIYRNKKGKELKEDLKNIFNQIKSIDNPDKLVDDILKANKEYIQDKKSAVQNKLYHSGVLSILPNIEQVARGDILYKLRDAEIKGIKSIIDYLDRTNSDTKYQLFIDSPLQETLNELSIAKPDLYGHYSNIVKHQKNSLRKQLENESFDKIDFHDTTEILKKDPRYTNICNLINGEYLDFKSCADMNTSNIEEDIEGEGPWFVYKRNACDAIRIITYENAKEILNINNTNTNIYMLHGDFDAKVKDNIHNFSDILKNFDEEYSIYTTDDEKQYIKNIFGNKKDLYEENYISFCQKHSMNLIIPKDNGSFLIKSEFQNIIPNDFDFKKELIDDAEGDTIWMLMDKKNFKELLPSDSNGYIIFKFVDKESQSQFITTWNVYKYLIESIQCLSNVPR